MTADAAPAQRGALAGLLDADLSWSRVLHVDNLTWISRALSLAGFGIAAYLTSVYVVHVAPTCVSGGGCVTVQHSKYAHIVGIPLPAIGLLGYGVLLLAACLPGQRARAAGMALTVFAICTSLGLTYLELNVIHAICVWCVASATCAALHVVVNSTRYVRGEPPPALGNQRLAVAEDAA